MDSAYTGVFAIGDEDSVLGFRLAGGTGEVVTSPEEAGRAVDRALACEEFKLLLVTREWAETMRKRFDRLRMRRVVPVVLEIPGKEVRPPSESLEEPVERAIGVKL